MKKDKEIGEIIQENATDLAIKYPTTSQYLALQEDAPDLGDIIRTNLGGEPLTAFSLPRIKVPGSGGLFWELPDTEEDAAPVKELVGISVHYTHPRSWWEVSLDDSKERTPPDCYSPDGQFGIAITEKGPGGDCQTCPYAQFGSAEKGSGQACKKKIMDFFLMEDSYLPYVIQVPTTSIKPIQDHFLASAGKGRFYYSMVSAFGLEKRMASAYPYSVIKPRRVKQLDQAEETLVKVRVGDAVRALLVNTPVMPEQD